MTGTADADFYGLEQLLDDPGRDAVRRTREFLTKEIGRASCRERVCHNV